MNRSPLRLLAALLGVLAGLLLAAGPAAAHGGAGVIEVTSTVRDGDQVTVTVRLTYQEDGHGVPDATVTVVVDDGTPVPMEPGDEEGDYTATVTAPEGAIIRVTSVEPATSIETPAPGEAPPPTEAPSTTEAATTTEAGPAPSEASGDDDAAGTDADEAVADTDADEDAEDADDGGSNTALIIGAVVAVIVVAAVVALVVLRRDPDKGTI